MINKIIRFFLENKLVTFLLLLIFVVWGIVSAPFDWETGILPRDPVPVDAIPDIGENQQIVYTEWPGRSPQDIEDQISYPLTTSLLGIPGVKTIRSNSIFGVSSIYIIFDEEIDFYWSRTRILEKLNSLPSGTLPEDVTTTLGPDATALGQVFWYTLEGRDEDGNPAGGWDPHELRTIQDFYVRYSLTSAAGVAEVASIGGFVKEYQVDIDPNAMKAHGLNIAEIMAAVKNSNLDTGARTIEFNRVEYLVRVLGYIKDIEDLEKSVVAVRDHVPIRLKDVAKINYGPATRRGGLDKGGSEAVGGVVVARYGANPLHTIDNVKKKIEEITPGLPSKILEDGTRSKVTIVPFYDRTGIIKETLGTLEEAISLELLISMLVVIVMILNLRASFLVSSLLPLGVLLAFIAMRQFGVDANIVALSGIAISIGVMVDVGVVFTENMIRHLEIPGNLHARGKKLLNVIYEATTEVAGAVITALTTTIVSFLPVFAYLLSSILAFGYLAVYEKKWPDSTGNILAFTAGTGNTGYFGIALALILFEQRLADIFIFTVLGSLFYETTTGYYVTAKAKFTARQSLKKVFCLPALLYRPGGAPVRAAGQRPGHHRHRRGCDPVCRRHAVCALAGPGTSGRCPDSKGSGE